MLSQSDKNKRNINWKNATSVQLFYGKKSFFQNAESKRNLVSIKVQQCGPLSLVDRKTSNKSDLELKTVCSTATPLKTLSAEFLTTKKCKQQKSKKKSRPKFCIESFKAQTRGIMDSFSQTLLLIGENIFTQRNILTFKDVSV